MRRKGIPKKRIGPEPGSRERSIRVRRFKVSNKTSLRSMEFENFTNTAQKSAYGIMSTSLCGKSPVMVEPYFGAENEKKEKIMKGGEKRESSVIYLASRSRERLTPYFESAGVKPFVIRPAQ